MNPVFKVKYFWFVITVILSYLLIVTSFYFYDSSLAGHLFATEGNLAENIASVAWVFSTVFCFIHFVELKDKKNSGLSWGALFVFCTLAFFREMDMHKNLESFLGIEWKTRWLRDPMIAVHLKFLMVGIVVSLTLLFLGALFSKYKESIEEFKKGNILTILLCLGFFLLIIGHFFDGSMFGHSHIFPFMSQAKGELFEESLETIAAITLTFALFPRLKNGY